MYTKQLEVFVAIAATGSFSKGAEAACTTQSTVSNSSGRAKGSGANDVVDTTLRKQGIKTSDLMVAAIMSSSEAIKQAVLADCGVTFISELAVRQELKQGELVSVKLTGMVMTRSFSIVHKRGKNSFSRRQSILQHTARDKAETLHHCFIMAARGSWS